MLGMRRGSLGRRRDKRHHNLEVVEIQETGLITVEDDGHTNAMSLMKRLNRAS